MTSHPHKTISEFWAHRASLRTRDAARFYDSHTDLDKALIARFVTPESSVLDLGCGTCVIANWLAQDCAVTVHAVDREAGFLDHAAANPRLTVEHMLIEGYQPAAQYDVILMLGVINYLIDVNARKQLYKRLIGSLPDQGVLIVKSQFGMAGPVEVNKYSEALRLNYYSLYPGIEEETALLAAVGEVEIFDLYPPELSPHRNTHFYHLVVRPAGA